MLDLNSLIDAIRPALIVAGLLMIAFKPWEHEEEGEEDE